MDYHCNLWQYWNYCLFKASFQTPETFRKFSLESL